MFSTVVHVTEQALQKMIIVLNLYGKTTGSCYNFKISMYPFMIVQLVLYCLFLRNAQMAKSYCTVEPPFFLWIKDISKKCIISIL